MLTKVSILFDYLSTAEKAYADHNERFRLHFKDIRTREEDFAALRKRDEQLASKIDSLEKKVSKMKEENKDLPANLQRLAEMRQEKIGLEHSVLNAEASLGDFKRTQTRAAMSYKLGAVIELAEKTVVLGSIGKLIVDEIQTDRTEPGGQRVYYDGFGRTDQLMSEAQRCVQDVVFNPCSDGKNPEVESPFQQQGNATHNYDSQQQQQGEYNGHSQAQHHQNEYMGGGQGEDYASPRADYNPYSNEPRSPEAEYSGGLAYPNTTLPPIEHAGALMGDGGLGADLTTNDFASQARDRSSLAYMTAPESDEDHATPPPMPSNAAERVATHDQTLSPLSDASEAKELAYQRELEQAKHQSWEQTQVPRLGRRPSEGQRYQYGLPASDTQYAPQQVDQTPAIPSASTPEASPREGSFHPHDKSVEPLVPRWGVPGGAGNGSDHTETSISYNAPSKPTLYVEERAYIPKQGDGAYHGPSQDPPMSSTSSHFGASGGGGNNSNSRNGSSVGSDTGAATTGSSQFQPKRPSAAQRGESALGSKYGDLGSPQLNGGSTGGTTPTAGNSGRFQLGGGATVGAQTSSGYFRPSDSQPAGGEMELPSQRKVNAGAFRRPQVATQEVPRWQGYQPGVGGYGGGAPSPQTPSGRSEAEEIMQAYRASAIPVPPSTGRNANAGQRDGSRSPAGKLDESGRGAPRFDVAPLRIDKRASVSAAAPGPLRQLNTSQSKGSLTASEMSSNLSPTSPTSYHAADRGYLSQQVAGSSGNGGSRGFGAGGYVTKLD